MKNVKNRTSTFRIDRNQLKIFLIFNDFYQILWDCRQPFLKWGNRTSRQVTSLPILLSFFFLSLGILQLSVETRNDSLLKNYPYSYPLLSQKIHQKFETFYLQLLEDKKNILEKNVLFAHERAQNNDCPCENCIQVKNFGEYLKTSKFFDHNQKEKVVYFYKTFNQLRDKLLEEARKAQQAQKFGEKISPIELYCLVPESYVHKFVHKYEDWIKNQSCPLTIDIHPSHFKKIQIRYPKNLCIETTPIWFQSFFHKTINESFSQNIPNLLDSLYHAQKTSDQIPRKIEGASSLASLGSPSALKTLPENSSFLPNWVLDNSKREKGFLRQFLSAEFNFQLGPPLASLRGAERPKGPRRLHAGFAAYDRKHEAFAAERRSPQRGACKREAFAYALAYNDLTLQFLEDLFLQALITIQKTLQKIKTLEGLESNHIRMKSLSFEAANASRLQPTQDLLEFKKINKIVKTDFQQKFRKLIKKAIFLIDLKNRLEFQTYNGLQAKKASDHYFFIKKIPDTINVQSSFDLDLFFSRKTKNLSLPNYLSSFRGFDWKNIKRRNIYKINCLDRKTAYKRTLSLRNLYNASWFWEIEDPRPKGPYPLDRPFLEEKSYILRKNNSKKQSLLFYMELKDMLRFSKFKKWLLKKSNRESLNRTSRLRTFINQNHDFHDSYNLFVPEDYLLESLYWYIRTHVGFGEILKGIQENSKVIEKETKKEIKKTETLDPWKNLVERFEPIREEYLNWVQEFIEGKHPYWKEQKSFDNKFSQVDKSLKYLLNFLKLRKNQRRQFLKICKKKIPSQTLLNSKRKIQFAYPNSYYKNNGRSDLTMDVFLKHCSGLDFKTQTQRSDLKLKKSQYLLKLKAEALKKKKGLKKKKEDIIKESKFQMTDSGLKPTKEVLQEKESKQESILPSHSSNRFELKLMAMKEILKNNIKALASLRSAPFVHFFEKDLNFLLQEKNRNLQKTYRVLAKSNWVPKHIRKNSKLERLHSIFELEILSKKRNWELLLVEKRDQDWEAVQIHAYKNIDNRWYKTIRFWNWKNQILKKKKKPKSTRFKNLLKKIPLHFGKVALNCDDFYDEIRYQIEKIDPSFIKKYYKKEKTNKVEVTVFKKEKFQKNFHSLFQLIDYRLEHLFVNSKILGFFKPYHTLLTRKASGYIFADWDFQYISTTPFFKQFSNRLEKWQVTFSIPQVPMDIQNKIGDQKASNLTFQSLEVLRDIGQKNKKKKNQTNLLKLQEQVFQTHLGTRIFKFYEKLSPYSWSIFFALSSGWFFMNVFRDLYKKYAKEILESCIDYIHRAGMIEKKDVEWIKVELDLMPVNIAYRGIRHQGKKLSSITGMDHLSSQINEMVHYLKTQKCISRQFLIFKFLKSLKALCLECLEPSVKMQIYKEKEQKERLKTKGFLFIGPPGTGKTLLVQAIAGETGVPVVTQSGGLLQNPREKRRGARTLHKLFLRARDIAPCIVFIDEIDGVGKRRILQPLFHNIHGQYDFAELLEAEGLSPPEYMPYEKMQVHQRRQEDFFDDTHLSWREPEFTQTIQTTKIPIEVLEDVQSFHAERNEQVSILMQLLIELDGIRSLEKILVIGATNRLEILDPALMRPGRFQQVLKISLPDYEGRINLLKFYIDKIHIEKQIENISWDYFAKRTHGFSSADIASVVFASELTAIHKGGGHTSKTLERGLDLITSYTRDPLKDRFQKISNFYEKSLEKLGPLGLNFFYFCENIQTQNQFVVDWIGSFRYLPTKIFSSHHLKSKGSHTLAGCATSGGLRFQLIPVGFPFDYQKQSRLQNQRSLKALSFKPIRRELLRRKIPSFATLSSFSFRIPTSFQFSQSLKI